MITLYHARMSRSTRVLWLLEELGADYRLVPVSIARPDGGGAPDPANPHPLKQVPAIEHAGTLIVESLAIWLYLTDLFPAARLAPAPGDNLRTAYMGLMGLSTAVFEPIVAALVAGRAFTEVETQAREMLDARIAGALTRTPYLLGDNFSTADLAFSSLLRYFPAALAERPDYARWLERIAARPALLRVREIEARAAT